MRDLKKRCNVGWGLMVAKNFTDGDKGMEILSKREYTSKEIEARKSLSLATALQEGRENGR